MYGLHTNRVVILFALVFYAVITNSCQKEEPPYQYPDPIITEPELITHFQRTLASGEDWSHTIDENNCKGDLSTINYAYYDIDTVRGFATMHLIPDSNTCELQVSLESEIKESEVADVDWMELDFEFTFSELILNAETELWLSLKYKELDMHIDFAPLVLAADSTIENGVLEINQDSEGMNFYVNGKKIKPNLELPGNRLSLTNTDSDKFIGIDLMSQGTDQQSLLVFQFLRITSFTIPD